MELNRSVREFGSLVGGRDRDRRKFGGSRLEERRPKLSGSPGIRIAPRVEEGAGVIRVAGRGEVGGRLPVPFYGFGGRGRYW